MDGVSISDPLNKDLFPNENFKASLVEIPAGFAFGFGRPGGPQRPPQQGVPYGVRDVPHRSARRSRASRTASATSRMARCSTASTALPS